MGDDKKKPSGGVDHTKLSPTPGKTYTVRVVFKRANNLPIADFGTQGSDPFVLAQCNTGLPTRHKEDPHLRFRSATARRSLAPRWDAEWVIAGLPAHGVEFKVRVYDEDNGTHDDLLGRVHIHTGALSEGYGTDATYKLTSRGANWRAWGVRNCMKPVSAEARLDPTIDISIQVLGETQVNDGKAYTVNNFWWTHYSPILGAMVGTTAPGEDGGEEESNFQANQIQLRGPVPNELYHRYVAFKGFVSPMFKGKGLRGRILHKLLHRQHEQVYHFDAETEYGRLPGPGKEMGQRFLEMAAWGTGHRIFTYIITLDGLLRFTETGSEFSIDMLSKHTMHSDVNIYIAFSGEFFVRKYKPDRDGEKVGRKHERNSLDVELEDEALEKQGKGQGVLAEKAVKPKDAAAAQARGEEGAMDEKAAMAQAAGVNGNVNGNGNGATQTNGTAQTNGAQPEVTGIRIDRSKKKGPDDAGKGKKNTLLARSKKAIEAQYDVPPQTETISGPNPRKGTVEPSDYELVIDNDSGTYRPDKSLLPYLQKFLYEQFGGLHVLALSCDDDVDQDLKKRRANARRQAKSKKGMLYRQANSSMSSISSSDAEAIEQGRPVRSKKEKLVDGMTNPTETAKAGLHHAEDKAKGIFHHKHKEEGADGEPVTGTTDPEKTG